eukprot:scaffold1521_cov271-Chaetoceros_neogracile.AAC.23
MNINFRKLSFAATSIMLGLWAFFKTNEISGPTFEPIIAECTNPDYSSAADFASKTGYHVYESKVGFGVFNFLVCLITQFLLELRETYPAGILVWGGVVLVSFQASMLIFIEAGRSTGARGPIRLSFVFPLVFGLLSQLIGVSVVFPLIWAPSYILGRGSGPITNFRANASVLLCLPTLFLTGVVFGASNTDSYLWTLCAGILGGPIIALSGLIFWRDVPPPPTVENIQASMEGIEKALRFMTVVGSIGWYVLVFIVFDWYSIGDIFAGKIWEDIWVNANTSVAFMTIDTGVFSLATLLCIAYQSKNKAIKMVMLTPIMGPAAASWVTAELEENRYEQLDCEKKDKEM